VDWSARNAALAADLPAAVMADLLGMHVTTAVLWVNYARRDWADYLAARPAEQAHTSPRSINPSSDLTAGGTRRA
jgi:hypothetical protein